MKLYHYTSVPLARAIFVTGLRLGHLRTQHYGIIRPVVWFTTSTDAEGHGLWNGSEILSAEQMAAAERNSGIKSKNKYTQNKKAIRIEVDSRDLDKFDREAFLKTGSATGLISYEKFSKLVQESNDFRKQMGLSCYYDLGVLPKEEIFRLMKKKPTKESTWYLHFGSVDVSLFSEVSAYEKGAFKTYDFERHGRPGLIGVGIHPVSAEMLCSLEGYWLPKNPLEVPTAACFCSGEADRPNVEFTNGTNFWRIYLDDPRDISSVTGELPHNISSFSEWVEKNKDALLTTWNQATASYYYFFPKSEG
ncbi:hypothetical protein [Pseudomonas sp. R76]|uniref:hypothetical protein n=1 Tax=Pseudomonas sp. R76 TaxID=1573711 RepID=UPI00135B2207|nr:hypothetical protein [Pseudomonas sp. R76]